MVSDYSLNVRHNPVKMYNFLLFLPINPLEKSQNDWEKTLPSHGEMNWGNEDYL